MVRLTDGWPAWRLGARAGPWAGVRVVDLTGLAGAYGTRVLAALGAEVIKVEPPGGDPMRTYAPHAPGVDGPESGLWWAFLSAGKKSVVIDRSSAEGEARLAALLARRTDGAILDLMTLLEVQRADGPAFNVLSAFGAEFPGLGGAAMVASRAFLDAYPDAARDLVRECLLAARKIQDPAVLKDQIEKHLGLEPGRAGVAANAYLAQKVWSVNGGLADGFMQRNIDFALEMGVLKPGLTPAAVEDRRYVNAALAELGRQ